jgi:hypothetical protein
MSLTHWADKELIKSAEKPVTQRNIFEIALPEQLPERRIYCYFEVKGPNGTTDQWIVTAEIVAFANGQPVGVFPMAFGKIDTSTLNASLPSLLNAGGSVVGDSLVLRIGNPFDTTNGPFTATLQPLRLNAEIDKLALSILSFSGAAITGWRSYLACLSTKF